MARMRRMKSGRDGDQVWNWWLTLEREDGDSEGLEDDDLDLINENIGASSKKVMLIDG